MTKIPHPLMDEGGNDAPNMKNFAVEFTAIIKGVSYIAAKSKGEAVSIFKDDEQKAFDKISQFGKYKITGVKEI